MVGSHLEKIILISDLNIKAWSGEDFVTVVSNLSDRARGKRPYLFSMKFFHKINAFVHLIETR